MPNDDRSQPVIPPVSFFSHHPLARTWTKLTAVDLHALHQPDTFNGQEWYFHLNHPLRYVSLLGVITAIDFPGQVAKWIVLTLDDGSGMSVECKSETLPASQQLENDGMTNQYGSPERNSRLMTSTDHLCVDHTRREVFLRGTLLDVGMSLKVQGTPGRYRNKSQLILLRANIVASTTAETTWWTSYAETVKAILNRPWTVTEKLRLKVEAEEEQSRAAAIKARQRNKEAQARKQRRVEKEERHRRQEEKWCKQEEMKYRGNPLV